jgi:hypothetical protein
LVELTEALIREVSSEETSGIVKTFLGRRGDLRLDVAVNGLNCVKHDLESLLRDLTQHPVFGKPQH